MEGKALHRCLHVLDIERSLEFYDKALGMREIRRMGPDDGSWQNVFIGNQTSGFQLELTWNRGRVEPYDNGGKDSHLAFAVCDFASAQALHEEMGCICHRNEAMGLYFIEDPDGCWIEILPDEPRFAAQSGIDVLDAQSRRRSVRRYTGEAIPSELLDRVIEAGLRSESGRDRKPWELIVVKDKTVLSELSRCRDHGSAMLADAEAAIVVIADAEMSDTWIEDCSIVMANMHLEASANAIGSCWIQGRMRTAQDGRTTQDYVSAFLDIPEKYSLEAILSLGMMEEAPERRPFEDSLSAKVHQGKF